VQKRNWIAKHLHRVGPLARRGLERRLQFIRTLRFKSLEPYFLRLLRRRLAPDGLSDVSDLWDW